ncbi:MAG: DUF2812 domain-containing protein [Bacteroidales bacterium]|nr:DUF2812 domain-containing protein [Bacteroidales bacterium]MBQ2447042.1 DUF2812 domain-containing protein [Bacteroidales bacterium]MBR0334967.1 DUF2812 domain-containing protein [Bacteroidales bacterium]
MEKKEIKKLWRFYSVADYEKEEAFLNEMARAGWNLTAVGFCRYIFRRGNEGEFIYKLDMVERSESDEVKESYFNFLSDCGIRVVGEFKDWIYLQKPASEGPFDMKNDTYAKLRHVNKVYSFSLRTVCNLLRLFAGIMVVLILLQLLSNNVSLSEFCSGVMLGVGVSSLIALVIIWVPIVNKLRCQVNKLIDDIGVNL